jgi:osmoprotectant transport system permease protein
MKFILLQRTGRIVRIAGALSLVALLGPAPAAAEPEVVRVGSKKFTESVILGEMVAHLVRSAGGVAEHRKEIGGTEILWRALVRGELDVYPEYTGTLSQVVLRDQRFFPAYHAVLLYRADLEKRAPLVVAKLRQLEGLISEAEMSRLNGRAKLDRVPEVEVAAQFLSESMGLQTTAPRENLAQSLWRLTIEHLTLVSISLAAAVLTAVPLGILAARRPGLGQVILTVSGVIQTIPPLALLVFLIPLLGIGGPPAVVALFLYSLLPIVRNTYAGLHDIPLPIRESAEALGLPSRARLWRVELPLASRAILAGIKTAAVINVGTATLGALIGAGGYGQPILTGIRLDDTGLILQGAVPAALMALAVHGLFEVAEKFFVPRGLRLKAAAGVSQ